ncbi:MAG: alpha/beta hydrolase [Cyanobacteria bacterium Co-bin13]|nr:alpha/beta hydrolase [Cyanobacteria bacterium Co-bin13]
MRLFTALQPLQQMLSLCSQGACDKFFSGRFAIALLLGATAALLQTPSARAVEAISLTYGTIPLQTVSLDELTTFVTTGEATPELQSLLESVNLDSRFSRNILGGEIDVNGELFRQAASTFIGEAFFQKAGTALTLSDASTESWQPLRDALVLASSDNRISLIEVLQAFEGPALSIDTQRVGEVAAQVRQDAAAIQAFLNSFRQQ